MVNGKHNHELDEEGYAARKRRVLEGNAQPESRLSKLCVDSLS